MLHLVVNVSVRIYLRFTYPWTLKEDKEYVTKLMLEKTLSTDY